ncbi:MAG: hypothetical protein E3K37_01495 [Candidatus Kuenenia sp.]|nr:hypothetical protein [Candidatus Kuenenia hertensis]
MDKKKLLSTSDILRILKIKRDRLEYLFQSGRLQRDQFDQVGKRRIYTLADVEVIRKALSDIRISN